LNNKLLSAIGMCKKAGKLVMGFDAVATAMRQGQVRLLALTGDISPKSAKEIIRIAAQYSVKHLTIDSATMDDIKRTVGKRAGILAITDQGLADSVAAKVAVLRPRQVEEESQ